MYKVIALSVSGKGKKIFSAGDVVNESDFPSGSVESLVKGGYIKEIASKAKVYEPQKEAEKPQEVAIKTVAARKNTSKRGK